ncbi:hypothetical protein MMC12_007655 [Toensbergia leucococca]|nr:hypothetical protein [Toensbergia leucococca]
MSESFQADYPWTHTPLIANAPMRLIARAPLAVAVSRAGGLGFIGPGNHISELGNNLQEAEDLLKKAPIIKAAPRTLPIGVGFINWGADLHVALDILQKHLVAVVWLFAPKKNKDLQIWTTEIRKISECKTKIWVQIGTVSDALEVARLCSPDVLVVQGSDAGGHGLERGAGIVSLLPEVADALSEAGFHEIRLIAAGGIMEGRGTAAALALGANGVAMGTRFLACKEAQIAKGYQDEVIRAKDGGISTVRSTVYDTLRGTIGWPDRFDGRGIINQSFLDAKDGKSTAENKENYALALKPGNEGWGMFGRLTTYAGTAVGLVKEVKSAQDIVEEIGIHVENIHRKLRGSLAHL